MWIQQSQLKTSYDAIVIGGGLSGLMTATALQNEGRKVLVLDRNPQATASCRHLGLDALPYSATSGPALEFLQRFCEPINFWTVEAGPVTYEAGFKPFVGFGEQSPRFVGELDYYLSPQTLFFKVGELDRCLSAMTTQFKGDHLAGYQVTQIHTLSGHVTGLTLGHGKIIRTGSLVFCDHANWLPTVLAADALSKKTLKSLTKTELWTSILLETTLKKKISERPEMHLLMGGKDLGDIFWGFFSPDEVHQTCQWMGLIPAEDTADSEMVATTLKKIQKQIKRAYPEFYEFVEKEHISVNYASHGSLEIALTDQQTLVGLQNLWMIPQPSPQQKNLLGLLQQTLLVLQSLGCSLNSPHFYPKVPADFVQPSP